MENVEVIFCQRAHICRKVRLIRHCMQQIPFCQFSALNGNRASIRLHSITNNYCYPYIDSTTMLSDAVIAIIMYINNSHKIVLNISKYTTHTQTSTHTYST